MEHSVEQVITIPATLPFRVESLATWLELAYVTSIITAIARFEFGFSNLIASILIKFRASSQKL